MIMQCVCIFCSNGLLDFIQLDEEKKKASVHCCDLDKKVLLNKLCGFFSGERHKIILEQY